MARKFSEPRDKMRLYSTEGKNMKHAQEVRFTHPISHFEASALEAKGKAVPPDWAESITQASIAVRQMIDALPGNDNAKAVDGLVALETAAANIRAFLKFRKAI